MIVYRVFRPGAGVVSRHQTLAGAEKSLRRQRNGAEKQGGFSMDFIQKDIDGDWVKLDELLQDYKA